MIKICKNRKIYTLDDVNPHMDPVLVDLDKVDPNKFVTACLNQNVVLEEGLTIEELMFFFSLCRDFIYDYFSDYYDRFQAMISTQQVGKKYQAVKVFKKLTVDRGYIFIEPCVDFIKFVEEEGVHKNDRPDFLPQVPIIMENQLVIQQDDISADLENLMNGIAMDDDKESKARIEGEYKMEFTLLDLMEAFLSDLIYSIEESRL